MSGSRIFGIGALGLVAAAGIAGATLAQAAEDHRPYAKMGREECAECHRGSDVAQNHDSFWERDHRVLAQKQSNNCNDCHQQSFCADCHQGGGGIDKGVSRERSRRGEAMPSGHEPGFVATHQLQAHDPRACYRCHDSGRFCADCHAQAFGRAGRDGASGDALRAVRVSPHAPVFVAPGVPDPSWTAEHRTKARRELKSCEACHPSKADCSNFACHPGLGGR
ncbi:MAG TPA: hypothetical protein VD838_02455 [Anaeromyxobacteraceae bacterium]|nr:hypothetical protein [Anaeromyxobacteraceae bacterium]